MKKSSNMKCPICLSLMRLDNKTEYDNYDCSKNSDHYLSQRLFKGEKMKLKIKLNELNGDRYHLLINYDAGTSEVWMYNQSSGKTEKIIVKNVNEPDFTNLDKLKLKIRTYFSLI